MLHHIINEKNISLLENQKQNQILEELHDFSTEKKISIPSASSLSYLIILDSSSADIEIIHSESHTNSSIYAIVFSEPEKKSKLSLQSTIKASHCTSTIHIISVGTNHSDLDIKAGITIEKDIEKGEGHLTEDNLILGKKVKIKSLPLLDIQSNDVKASHGAKIHQFDPSKIFYMTSKGLSKKQAEKLLLEGIITNAFENFSPENNETLSNLKDKILAQLLKNSE
ncbi:MAG TPA: SufD family Fe-S cluster assembly protein [Candidatus Absconditabacterales bacterium]|nr:SufD family Fe-S cluster assembly protein [Candidatus Absconditabacterales bacterium]HMT27123.1 SufD family Fe-S cluster assembly protein [Candidatus Absconditabacterales bacterium]